MADEAVCIGPRRRGGKLPERGRSARRHRRDRRGGGASRLRLPLRERGVRRGSGCGGSRLHRPAAGRHRIDGGQARRPPDCGRCGCRDHSRDRGCRRRRRGGDRRGAGDRLSGHDQGRSRPAAARACGSSGTRPPCARTWPPPSTKRRRPSATGGVFVERFIVDPRHIEIQVLADGDGAVVHLGEREVLDPAPPPEGDRGGAEPAARQGDAGGDGGRRPVRSPPPSAIARAGTVEFVADQQRNFYFLEMNTRLQVEHPITEMVTGVDLVEQQIRIAAGEPLAFGQADVTRNGWAMECRIYAEDPVRGFVPSIGRLSRYREPPASDACRVDAGVDEGSEISMFYDPMIAKLVAYGADRPAAIACDAGRARPLRDAGRRPQRGLPQRGGPPPALRRGAALHRLHRGGVRRGASIPRRSPTRRWRCSCRWPRWCMRGSRPARPVSRARSRARLRSGTWATGWSISAPPGTRCG